jgi:hypothetical protein
MQSGSCLDHQNLVEARPSVLCLLYSSRADVGAFA